MDSTNSPILECLKDGTTNAVTEFRLRPVDFVYESDIQSLLFAILRDAMRNIRYKPEARDVESLFKSVPSINPVKTEYPLNIPLNMQGRFDVAVLSAKQDPSLRIWERRGRRRLSADAVAFSPDGRQALSGSPLRLWEVELVEYISTLQGK